SLETLELRLETVGRMERSAIRRNRLVRRVALRSTRPTRVSIERRGRLLVDAAQETPIPEQVARADLARRQFALAQESVEREIGVKTDMPRQMGQPLFHEAERPVFAGEMVDQHD